MPTNGSFVGTQVSNTKKYHLVNWKVVKIPKDRVGLGIRDPILMNISLGVKFLWRTITNSMEWWKRMLWKNYFIGARKRCI